jgi:FkbM family methyltransferase
MTERTLSDHLVAMYSKIFPWRFRHRFGSPLVGSLMKMKGNKVTIRDFDVSLNPDDKTATELFLVHAQARDWIWESYEIALFLNSLKANPNPLAVDMGANYGAYSLTACSLALEGVVQSIIAVEPNRETFACLSDSVASNGFGPYVHLVNAAVARDHNADVFFYPHDSFSAMSKGTIATDPERLSGHSSPYKVRGITLDGLLPELGISGVDSLIIKIDVEGSEPDAFRGMEATLKSVNRYQVFFELHPSALMSLGHDPLEFGRYLFGLGVDVVAEVDQHQKATKRIRNHDEFASIVERCLTTTEMWQDYTNLFISKGLKIPFEISE